jgi:hypothetical protein
MVLGLTLIARTTQSEFDNESVVINYCEARSRIIVLDATFGAKRFRQGSAARVFEDHAGVTVSAPYSPLTVQKTNLNYARFSHVASTCAHNVAKSSKSGDMSASLFPEPAIRSALPFVFSAYSRL